MKKILARLCMVVAVALFVVGCKKGPDAVAVKFFECVADGKYEKAADYASSSTKPLVAMMNAMPAEAKEEMKGSKIKAVETKIDGDKATVKLEITDKNGKVDTDDVDLVKEDGEWKVNVKK